MRLARACGVVWREGWAVVWPTLRNVEHRYAPEEVSVTQQADSDEQETGVMKCKGVNGTGTFDGTWVTIDRKGLGARATVGKGEKKIALTQITSVRWKQPSRLIRGYIAFSLPGGVESKSGFGKQTVDATKDADAVVFRFTQADEFLALKEYIEDALAQHCAASPAPVPAAAPEADPAEQLKKLVDLHQSGLLTDEEFAAKRAALVDKLWADT